ncbi:MAG: Rieske (2Fe-2S) protein [Candidatus Binatia bacterium]
MSEKIRVATVADLQPGRQKIVEVQGREVALFNVGGEIYALDNTCPHAGFPLGEGDISGDYVICPGHSFHYDLATGECLNNPDMKATCFEVRIEGDDILIAL